MVCLIMNPSDAKSNPPGKIILPQEKHRVLTRSLNEDTHPSHLLKEQSQFPFTRTIKKNRCDACAPQRFIQINQL